MKRTSPDCDSNQSAPSRDDSPPGAAAARAKRVKLVNFEPVRLPSISTASHLDQAVIAVQHQKLTERLRHRLKLETELRNRIKSLEQRQIQDDDLLFVINRYWNQLDEDMRLLLQRFDAETAVESEQNNQSDAVTSFVAKLSQWDKSEIELKLQRRVEFSRRAVKKLVETYDRLLQRNEKINNLLQKLSGSDSASNNGVVDVKPDVKTEITDDANEKKLSPTESKLASASSDVKDQLGKELVDHCSQLQTENKRLQLLCTRLQSDNSELRLKVAKSDDVVEAAETKVEEIQNKLEDAEFELENSLERENKLDYRLHEVVKQLQDVQERLSQKLGSTGEGSASSGAADVDEVASVSKNKLEQLQADLDEQRELATNRLQELQDLTDNHRKAQGEIARLELDLKHTPDEVIKASVEYKSLQSQFSVLFAEATKMRNRLEETITHLHKLKSEHLKQIEQMEAEELLAQHQLRNETLKLQEQLNQIRREYEMLRLEFEQNLAANEQSGPVNREMRKFLDGCRNQNESLNQEVKRFKKKWQEAVSTIARMQRELDSEKKQRENSLMIDLGGVGGATSVDSAASATSPKHGGAVAISDDDDDIDTCDGNETPAEPTPGDGASLEDQLKHTKEQLESTKARLAKMKEKLAKLKQLGTADKQVLKQENVRLKEEISKLANMDRREKHRFYSEEAHKRIKYLEAETDKLRKEATSSKQFEEELLSEIEVTGQAFEDMKEQNTRLLAELKEKDEANFKHMSERIRSNQQQKKLKEDKDLIEEQVGALQNQIDAQHLVVKNLEEKERLLQHNMVLMQKEIHVRQQSSDVNRRKAIEFAQSTADLKLQLEKMQAQLADAQQAVVAKAATKEDPSFKIRRLQEEITQLKRRVDRAKKFERANQADEVFLEEIKELKDELTCTQCKVNRKDAILSKCHHVFCMNCLKQRFDTRRRKCPKCNAAFGANDFHRIYLS